MGEPQTLQSSTSTSQNQPFILVVDDDHYLRQTIQSMLEEEGFAVRTAADGQEAVEQVLAEPPALLILDMGLPLLGGSAVAAQIRQQYGEAIPLVLITADGHAEEKSRRIGAKAFLKKPFDFEHLIAVVEQTMGEH